MKINAKLKSLRLQHGLTQQQVAQKLHCSVPAYSKVETGATDITGERLLLLAEIYGIPVWEILKVGEQIEDEAGKTIEDLTERVRAGQEAIASLQGKLIFMYEKGMV